MSDYYILKIYYSNGVIEERKVFSINDLNILERGKNKVNIQFGKGTKNGYLQSNFNILHGVTNNITLGVGNRILTSEKGRRYSFIENDILLNTRHKIFPTVIELKNYHEITHKENNYNLNIIQKYKEWQLNLTYETYSKYIFYENGVKNYKSVSLGKNFKNNYLEVGVNKETLYRLGINKNIYTYWSTYKLAPIYFSLKLEKSLENISNRYAIYPTISYYGYFSTVVEGKFVKENNSRWTNSYNLKIRKRNVQLIKDKLYGDIGLFFKYYSDRHTYTYGVDFNIKLDDFIYARVNSNVTKRENGKSDTGNGIEINKIFALKKPSLKLDNNSSVTSSVIYGNIFLDKNSNGVYDEGDLPLENGIVIIDGMKFKSDKQGRYIASGISSPRTIELEIDRKSIDPMIKATFKKLKIRTESSGQLRVDIPLDIISIVSGNIYNGLKLPENKFSRKLALVNIQLIKDNTIVSEIKPEFDGLYFFEDVFPGKYKIKFSYLGPEKYKFSTKEIDVNIDTSGKESGDYFEGYDTELITGEVK
ncbi:hypothetical protein [uncultured Fusobacterium sp.]|uniref:hypothetical protein n=1 Tax=uncultured Fusobacterium sp. TaxID=159267 RepID=UPI002596D57C|nr:hypothetical protein [uncultured Fusobacterium sp.]